MATAVAARSVRRTSMDVFVLSDDRAGGCTGAEDVARA